jgi:hypothetical protein
LQDDLRKVAQLAEREKIQIAAFSLQGQQYAPSRSDPFGPDHVYRSLLRDNLELLFYDWLPHTVSPAPSTVAVHVATRVLGDGSASGPELLSLARRFGLGIRLRNVAAKVPWGLSFLDCSSASFSGSDLAGIDAYVLVTLETRLVLIIDDKALSALPPSLSCIPRQPVTDLQVFSFSHEDVHPLVTEVFSRRPHRQPPHVIEAKGVRLEYGSAPNLTPHQLPRPIHFVADWVISKPSLIPKTWLKLGFQRVQNNALLQTLQTSRLVDEPGSFIRAATLWCRKSPENDAAEAGIREKLQAGLNRMTGIEFVRFCQLWEHRSDIAGN